MNKEKRFYDHRKKLLAELYILRASRDIVNSKITSINNELSAWDRTMVRT
jgi:hypothetical protein